MLEKKIISITKKIEGKLICFFIEEKRIIKSININDKIVDCDLFDCWNDKENEEKKGNYKNFYITQLRKKYKKKKINYIICNIDKMDKYLKIFIKDSIYINNNIIYLFSYNKNYNFNKVIKKYNRYNVKIDKIEVENGIILKIETKDAFNHKISDSIYYIIDSIGDLLNMITDILMN